MGEVGSLEVLHELKLVWEKWEALSAGAVGSGAQFLWLLEVRGNVSLEGAHYDESTHLSFEDVEVDKKKEPSSLKVRLKVMKATKTDPFRKGIDVFVGRTGNRLCPVMAMLAYLRERGSAPGPLFHLKNGLSLTRPQFVLGTQKALRCRGISVVSYLGHSFWRSCYHSSSTRSGRGHNEDAWKVVQHGISGVYQDTKGTPGTSGPTASGQGEGASGPEQMSLFK